MKRSQLHHRHPKMTHSGDVSTDDSAYDLEFRCSEDDAWYSVRVVLNDDTLTVKFWTFPEACDEIYKAGDFQTLEAVHQFVQKFRPISAQLQDSQCLEVMEGRTVCASFIDSLAFKDDDIRFYDAVVEAVHHERHSFSKEEEECLCSFVLLWQHGPKEGTLTSVNTADICLIQSAAQVDPRVVAFSKMAREKIEIASFKSGLISKGDDSSSKGITCDQENGGLSIKLNLSLSQDGLQEMESVRQFGSPLQTTEGRFDKLHERIDQDRDFGGESLDIDGIEEIGGHHFILIENLEKDLSASSMMEFIHKQTSISPQAYIIPCLSSESYTRGAIVLDCKKKLKKIYEFLNNPDHIIMSSRGRPWFIKEKVLRYGTFRMPLESLMPEYQYKFQNKNIDGELKVVHLGTEEYRTAKRLRDLFMDFLDHQQRLHKSSLQLFFCSAHQSVLRLPKSNMGIGSLRCVIIVMVSLLLILRGAVGIRFVIDKEECFSHNVQYEGDTIHVSFVVIKADAPWHFGDDGVDLVIKGPSGELIHDFRDKSSEKYDFVVHEKGVYHFCFTNKSPYHETIDFDVHAAHFTYYDQHAKDEHFSPLLEQISKLEEALYNIQFEQHWLEAQTDRQAIVNEGMSQRTIHKAMFESAALIGASVLQIYLLKRLFERKLGTSRV
ncbi:hypothetical protein F0562_011305 [Nyssa sinensis]|uniref:GOLD domain-containing protein n=1 Tax=Nyssa sinensis TaxID=561372 RepID=A0A5J5A4X0_9ASTE|nr:hypothetical protein F0562_011305 [Nyssa sinensis]